MLAFEPCSSTRLSGGRPSDTPNLNRPETLKITAFSRLSRFLQKLRLKPQKPLVGG